jgi:cytochrome c5
VPGLLPIIAGWFEAPREAPDIEDAMSADPHYQATEEAHTGPIKNPKQLLLAVFFSFIAPIAIIVGLVSFVVSGTRPSGTAEGDNMALYGVSKDARDRELADRLKKVGAIEIRDANRALAAGDAVFKAQCIACHGAPGIPGAPHLNDAAAWAPRIGQGYATLLEHALKGKGAMPPQGGGDFEDLEIGRAVVYMANAGGATFPVPDRPAAGAAPAEGAASAAAPAASK